MTFTKRFENFQLNETRKSSLASEQKKKKLFNIQKIHSMFHPYNGQQNLFLEIKHSLIGVILCAQGFETINNFVESVRVASTMIRMPSYLKTDCGATVTHRQ